jgi:hypothetical protein
MQGLKTVFTTASLKKGGFGMVFDQFYRFSCKKGKGQNQKENKSRPAINWC